MTIALEGDRNPRSSTPIRAGTSISMWSPLMFVLPQGRPRLQLALKTNAGYIKRKRQIPLKELSRLWPSIFRLT